MVRVRVTEFTDPYCTWCWGAEPVVRRLREVYRDQLRVEFVMGGQVEDYDDFHDPGGDHDHPEEVAPHWVTAAHRHGMPVDASLWETDPPKSSYPACIAYEAATFQDGDLADRFLRRMREAGLARARNLERIEVLADLAGTVGLDVDLFRTDFASGRAREAFEADLRRVRQHGGASLPAFHVVVDGREELLRGYRPFVAFEKLFAEQAPDLVEHDPRPLAEFVAAYGSVAAQEVAEVYGISREEATSRLRELPAVEAIDAGNGSLWERR
ncbi:MAG: DsbA family protein [Halobacteriales archaeon]